MVVNDLFTTDKIASAELILLLADADMNVDIDNSFVDRYATDIDVIEYVKIKFDALVNLMSSMGEMSYYSPENASYDDSDGSNRYIAKCINQRGHTIIAVLEMEYDIKLTLSVEGVTAVILTTDPTYRGY